MPEKVDLTWVRTARVVERGTATVLVNDPNDAAEINAKVLALDFREFLIQNREYKDELWSYTLPEKVSVADSDPSPNDN